MQPLNFEKFELGLLDRLPMSDLFRTVYMVLAPTGACDFTNLVAEKICTMSSAEGLEDRHSKFVLY